MIFIVLHFGNCNINFAYHALLTNTLKVVKPLNSKQESVKYQFICTENELKMGIV